jgi:hypothetical protein
MCYYFFTLSIYAKLYLLLVYLEMILLILPSTISNANDALTGVVVFQLTPTLTHQFMHSSLLIKLTNYRHWNQYFSYILLAMFNSICYFRIGVDGHLYVTGQSFAKIGKNNFLEKNLQLYVRISQLKLWHNRPYVPVEILSLSHRRHCSVRTRPSQELAVLHRQWNLFYPVLLQVRIRRRVITGDLLLEGVLTEQRCTLYIIRYQNGWGEK